MSVPTQLIHNTGAGASGTRVFLNDGSFVIANAAGVITVPSDSALHLISAGWSFVVTGGTTHVP
jgi:hypothetical protein